MSGDLLQTKLYIPASRPFLVPRPRLIEKLNAGLHGKLTLICAPAGFGKTTLIAEWGNGNAESFTNPGSKIQNSKLGWLSLDEHDNDPARFLTYFIAAIQQIEASIGDTTLALLQSPQRPPPEAALTPLINEIAAMTTPFILALDDYHTIQTPAIHQSLAFILEHQPPQMHLVILTREDPPLPLARLRARGQATEIRQDDLRFTTAETAVFLHNIMKLDLAPDDIAALERRTEGWIAGLQLAALSMQGRGDIKHFVRAFTGSNRYILDYLIEEVFARQAPEVQDFLLKTSILDRLSAPLCDAVTDRNDSNHILFMLEQANLFIVSLDQSRRWFRYHRLFAELLRHRLRISDQHSETFLRQKAAGWYEDNGFLADAAQHTLAAQDWNEAERVIGLASLQAIMNGQFTTLHSWFDGLPNAIVQQSAELAHFKAWACFFMGQFEDAAEYSELAKSLFPADAPPFHLGALAALRASLALAQFNIPQAIQLSQETLDIIGDDDPFFLRGMALNNLGQAQTQMGNIAAATQAYHQLIQLGKQDGHHLTNFGAVSSLAWLLNIQEKRSVAIAMCQQTLPKCMDSRGRPLPLAGLILVALGLLYLDGNELDEAQQYIDQGVKVGEQLGPAGGGMNGLAAQARLQQARGEEKAALAIIQEIRQMGAQVNVPLVEMQIAGFEAVLSPTDTPNHLRESDYFTLARLLLAQNRLDEAQTLLTNFEQFTEENGRYHSLLVVSILQSLMELALDRKEQAVIKLERALRLAAPEGYLQVFVEDGRPLFPLLPALRHIAPDFVDQLLRSNQTVTDSQTPPPAVQLLAEPLSQRELEVLQLVADGLTNREIAVRAFISVGTVKSHVHHILEKLAVGNRTQAVARARELDLI